MSSKRVSLAFTTLAFAACGWAVACSSSNNGNGGSNNTSNSSNSGSNSNSSVASNSSGSNGSNSSGGDGGGNTQPAGCGSSSAPCIDNQSAATGSSISLNKGIPSGGADGTWFTYGSDSGSQSTPGANGQAISPKQYTAYTFMSLATPAMPTGGPTITTAACLASSAGFDGYSVGEGFHFVTKSPDGDASDSQPIPYDVSTYTGITFWAMATQAMGTFHLRVKFPDDQTDGDAFAAPGNTFGNPPSGCFGGDAASNSQCFDDFSVDLPGITGTWAQQTITFSTDLAQHHFGASFTAIDLMHVYGIEFEVEGLGAPGGDAGLAPGFSFCIADIAFTK